MSFPGHKVRHPTIVGTAIVAVGLLAIACGQPSVPTPEPVSGALAQALAGVPRPPVALEPSPTPVPVPAPPPTPTPFVIKFPPTPTPVSLPLPAPSPDYDSNANMYLLISGERHPESSTLAALGQARAHRDASQVPALVEFMRFREARDLRGAIAQALRELTGERFGEDIDGWLQWSEWLGKHLDDYPPPDGYVEWKINLLSELVSERFRDFLGTAESTARIDLREVVWGGVGPDGIPDLNSPNLIDPSEDRQGADYLQDDDRVFGVSINGEHRAYPVRILGRHEMVNDVVGGEQIALAY